ncbi:MAG: TldD/PmbA family protein [Clostridia bacterium]|nr:TldD/PmbA family protein [Clostridia bacterium]
MLDRILELLKTSGADGWEVTDKVAETWEFYLIRHALDQNRVRKTETVSVRVYKKSEDGKFLGSAGGEIPPTADEKEARRLISQLLLAASLVKNPVYSLNKPEEIPGTAAEKADPAEIAGEFLRVLQDLPETETEDLNSAEIFVSSVRKRFLNSEGIDLTEEYPSSSLEAVINARRDGKEIELYRMYNSGTCDREKLLRDLAETLSVGRDKLIAQPTPALGRADVVFSTVAARELYTWYIYRLDAQDKYCGYSDWEIGKPVTEQAEGDKVTVKAVPFLPNSSWNSRFDREGAPIRETVILRDNVPESYHGAQQFCRYLGLEHSFIPSNFTVSGGKRSAEELRTGNYLEVLEFSDFQVDTVTGDIMGEIRLGYLHDGDRVIPVSGGSLSGTMDDFAKTIRFSRETRTYDWAEIPAVTRLTGVKVTGAE